MEVSTLYSIFKDCPIPLALPIFINVHSRLSIVQMRKNEINYDDIVECVQITRNFEDGFKPEELHLYAGIIYEAVAKTKFSAHGPRLIMKKELIGNDENYFRELLRILSDNLLKDKPQASNAENSKTDIEGEIPDEKKVATSDQMDESTKEDKATKDEAEDLKTEVETIAKDPENSTDSTQLRALSMIQSLKKDMEKFLGKPLSPKASNPEKINPLNLQKESQPLPLSQPSMAPQVKIPSQVTSLPPAPAPALAPAPAPTMNEFNFNNYNPPFPGNAPSFPSSASFPSKENFTRPQSSQWEVLQNDFNRSGLMNKVGGGIGNEEFNNSFNFPQNRSSFDPSYYNSSRPMMTKPTVSAQQFQQQQLLQQQFQQQLSSSGPMSVAAIEKNEGMIKFLAYVRKGGMDILFPQLLHDKVIHIQNFPSIRLHLIFSFLFSFF